MLGALWKNRGPSGKLRRFKSPENLNQEFFQNLRLCGDLEVVSSSGRLGLTRGAPWHNP